MVKLKNIVKSNNVISAFYEPEHSAKLGYIEIDTDGNILKKEYSEYDKDFPWYFQHALSELRRLVLLDEPPKESTVAWF